MAGLYKVSLYIGKEDIEVNLAADGIADVIDLAVQRYKRMGVEEVDIYAVKRIDEFD